MPLALDRPGFTLRSLGMAAASILIGAWSHTFWDSFTHKGGWAVERIPFLKTSLLSLGGTPLPLSYLLQQLSTVGAGLALACIYFDWLRRQRPAPVPMDEPFSDRSRYLLLMAISVVSMFAASPFALEMASHYAGFMAFRVFVFRIGIYSTMIFLPLLVLCAVGLHAAGKKQEGK